MTYVLDASVAVAALRSTEPHHAAALQRCAPLFAGRDAVVVPALFDIELVAALVRRGVAATRVALFLERHFATRRVVTIGPRAARAVRAVVAATRLRAADSVYVWLAAREGLPLVTLDAEVVSRAPLAGVSATMP